MEPLTFEQAQKLTQNAKTGGCIPSPNTITGRRLTAAIKIMAEYSVTKIKPKSTFLIKNEVERYYSKQEKPEEKLPLKQKASSKNNTQGLSRTIGCAIKELYYRENAYSLEHALEYARARLRREVANVTWLRADNAKNPLQPRDGEILVLELFLKNKKIPTKEDFKEVLAGQVQPSLLPQSGNSGHLQRG